MVYKGLLLFLSIFITTTVSDLQSNRISIFKNVKRNARVTSQCNYALTMYEQNLMESPPDDSWALKMLDATSKIPVGFLYSYNFGELGNFKQCLETESNDKIIKGKYCLGSINVNANISTLQLNNTVVQIYLKYLTQLITNLQIQQSSRIPYPTWAVCLPSDCTDSDTLEIINSNDLLGLQFFTVMCQTKEDVDQPLNIGAILALYVSLPLHVLFTAFSVYSNGKQLFKASKSTSEISCLNGLKFLSIVWVVVGHTFSVYTAGAVSNVKDAIEWTNTLESMIIVNGTLSVDTFLVIGGALLVYVSTRAKHQGKKFNIFQYYIHRYVRLTPAFAAAILVSATLLEYMSSGPKWVYIRSNFAENCKLYWWTAFLYVQNYVNVSKMCVGHSWYLDIDMQLYLVSPIILFLLWKYHKTGLTALAVLVIIFIILPFYIAYQEELSGVISNLYPKTATDIFMNHYYLKTHTRAAPWLIGVFLGYLLSEAKFKNYKISRMNKGQTVLAWIICLSVLLTCIFCGHSTLRGPEYDRLGNAFYIALVRPVWSLCVAWIIWACVMDYGGPINSFLSLSIFQILNKFTYSLYLVHVTLLYMIVFSSKTSIYFSPFNMIYLFWGIYMISFGISIVWVLAFESPTIVIEKWMFKTKK